MSEHTPTPWVIPAGDQNDFIVCAGDDAEKPGEILFVLHKPLGRRSVAVDQQIGANTAHIVKCVNSHDALLRRVAALEMIIREDLRPDDCSDDLNRMLVEGIHAQPASPPAQEADRG